MASAATISPTGLTRRTWRSTLGVMWAVALARLRIMSRYPGFIVFNVFLPLVIAYIPIVLGRAVGGAEAEANFAQNVGTAEYAAYMLLGANVYMIVTNSLWFVGNWMRREQETGTLEALYLTPSDRVWMVAGTALAGAARAVFSSVLAFVIGCLLLGVNPMQGNILLALVFLLFGLVPMFGLSLAYGAAVLRFKEAGAMINAAQWVFAFLMGVYFPLKFLPPLLYNVALLFPPTWQNNGVRSALLGVGYLSGSAAGDLLVMAAFAVLAPLAGHWGFGRVERGLQRNEGIGQF